jgi:hypothetical protein
MFNNALQKQLSADSIYENDHIVKLFKLRHSTVDTATSVTATTTLGAVVMYAIVPLL